MTPAIPLIGAVSAALLILFPGWGIRQVLTRVGVQFERSLDSVILTSFAFGVHLNAALFLFCWVFVNPAAGRELGIILVAINIATGIGGSVFRKPLPRSNIVLWGLLIAGTIVGEYAAMQFPNVLDSVQALQVQQYILGWNGGWAEFPTALSRAHHFLMGGMSLPTQPGFAGLLLVPSLLQLDLPVVTVAAGVKIQLLFIAAVASHYAARRFALPQTGIAALLIFANMLLSHFGFYGLLFVGKDSMFAVLMVLASTSAAHDADQRSHESGLFMSSAILLGAVSVPFLLMFWAVYFVASFGRNWSQVLRQATWSICPLVISVVGVRAAFATPGSHTIGLLPAFIVLIVALVAANYFGRRFMSPLWLQPPTWWPQAMAAIPIICITATALLLPATAPIYAGKNGASEITVAHAPLDGIMTAFGYFYALCPMNNALLSTIALITCSILPLTVKQLRSPFYIAFFSFLPAPTFAVLLHLKLNLHVLPNFNIWDITRDTVTWYVGTFSAIIATVGAISVSNRFSLRMRHLILPLMSLLFLGGLYSNFKYFDWLINQPLTTTSSGGYSDKETAIATDYLWRNARGEPLYVSRESVLGANYPIFQMYGPRSTDYFDEATITAAKVKSSVFIVNASDARKALNFGKRERSGIEVRGIGGDAYIVHLKFDDSNSLESFDVPNISVTIDDSAYPVEHAQGRTFRWIGANTKLTFSSVLESEESPCVTLQLINPWGDKDLSVTIATARQTQTFALPYDATFANPFPATVCLSLSEGDAAVNVRSSKAPQHFPNDSRQISFGLVWPPEPQ